MPTTLTIDTRRSLSFRMPRNFHSTTQRSASCEGHGEAVQPARGVLDPDLQAGSIDRWGWKGQRRGRTLDAILNLPADVSFGAFARAVAPTQTQDPLGQKGWVKVIIGCAEEQRGALALLALRWIAMERIPITRAMYSAAITACEKSGMWAQALKLFDDLTRSNLQHDVVSYSAAIAACAEGAQWQRALDLLRDMRKPTQAMPHGLRPNDITLNSAMTACARGSQWQRALVIFDCMRQSGQSMHQPQIQFGAAIDACAKGLQWKQALRTLILMYRSSVKRNVVTYNPVIEASLKCGQTSVAQRLLESMKEESIQPNANTVRSKNLLKQSSSAADSTNASS